MIVYFMISDSLDSDVFMAYLEKHSPVFPDTEGRIKFVKDEGVGNSTVGENDNTNTGNNTNNGTNTGKNTNNGNIFQNAYYLYVFTILLFICL